MTALLEANNVSISTDSKVLNIHGEHLDCSYIAAGMILLIGNYRAVEAISGTAPDSNGNSTITLRHSWPNSGVNNGSLLGFNSPEAFRYAVEQTKLVGDTVVEIIAKFKGLLESESPTVSINTSPTQSTQTVPYGYLKKQLVALIDQANSLVGSIQAPSKTQFFAMAEQRRSQCAGSGSDTDNMDLALEIEAIPTVPNRLRMLHQVKIVHGFRIEMPQHDVLFAPACDGLDKKDGGRFDNLAAAIVAGGTSLNQSVLTRTDALLPEIFFMKVSQYDFVYPYGDSQYDQTEWEGIALRNDIVPQGFSASGEHDETTRGYGFVWSTATAEQKQKYINAFYNNVYSDNGELVSICFRRRAFKGLGNQWENIGISSITNSDFINYNNNYRPRVQGTESVANDFTGGVDCFANNDLEPIVNLDNGLWGARANGTNANRAHNGLCFALPMVLLERNRNQGLHHQSENSHGCATTWSNTYTTASRKWHEGDALKPASKSDCFNIAPDQSGFVLETKGSIGNTSGRIDGKSYDSIEAEDIVDFRMSARKPNLHDLHARYEQKALSAEIRGYQSVPFWSRAGLVDSVNSPSTTGLFIRRTDGNGRYIPNIDEWLWIEDGAGTIQIRKVESLNGEVVYLDSPIDRVFGAIVWFGNLTTCKSNKPTQVDFMAVPENFKAMLDAKGWDGMLGQWIPVLPDSALDSFPLNEKSSKTSATMIRTTDNGATFASVPVSINAVTNEVGYTNFGTNWIGIITYETQAKFLEEAVNAEVLVRSESALLLNHHSDGQLLNSSLFGKVPTGQYSGGQHQRVSLTNVALDPSSGKLAGASRTSGRPKNGSVNVGLNANSKLTSKTFSTLTYDNGQLYLQFYATQLKYGADWGDTGEFVITKNPITDDNNTTVLTAIKRVALPYFYTGE